MLFENTDRIEKLPEVYGVFPLQYDFPETGNATMKKYMQTEGMRRTLPVLPGDDVYYIHDDKARTVQATKVQSITLDVSGKIEIYASIPIRNRCSIGQDIFLTAEDAEQEAAKTREPPPYDYVSIADKWMPLKTWNPPGEKFCGVQVVRKDGKIIRKKAYYDPGYRYADERGFYESDRRNARRINRVIAWIAPEYMETDEWYNGEALDSSHLNIEEMDFSIRLYNILERNGIDYVCQILKLPDKDAVLRLRNMGRYSYEELITKLEEQGFHADHLK